jgi:uncharacterized protein YodC (DUF2158 family)
MIIRRFKPGDRVRKKGEKQLMVVQNYCVNKEGLLGNILSNRDVKCTWYENGRHKSGVFDQRTLIRASKNHQAIITTVNKTA